ncbi:MAG: murein transglycosylase A [Burkholderiales bacterium]|jgi:membrane-bound lytic murein transglycosylase A|nr:murein transglycosylase A [Burkholderiales bacterium]
MKQTTPIFIGRILFLLFLLTLSGCKSLPVEPQMRFDAVSWNDLSGWREDALNEAFPAWLLSCRALTKSTKSRAQWENVCNVAQKIDPDNPIQVRAYFEQYFVPHRVIVESQASGVVREGLITGYYEPIVHGSRVPTERFRYPVYARPDDLLTVELDALFPELKGKVVRGRLVGNKVVPYFPRETLDQPHARVNALVLCYMEDIMDVFFLQVQGSGRVLLEDGTLLRVGYSDQNGHPYRAIGGVLVARGEIPKEKMSMQAIRRWGEEHPKAVPELLNQNPSYVFFRELPPSTDALDLSVNGPIGALGVPLLANRAIAVDRNKLPLGAPVFIATTLPDQTPLKRLTMAQDTGGAIAGALRADFFFGSGDGAGALAGEMKNAGQLWVLLPKDGFAQK